MTVSKPVVASTVRDYFRADEKRMARLSAEAQATVAQGARGRLHAQAVKEFNSKRKAHRRYAVGASTQATDIRQQERAVLREQGLAGRRGPLSKAAKAALAQSKG